MGDRFNVEFIDLGKDPQSISSTVRNRINSRLNSGHYVFIHGAYNIAGHALVLTNYKNGQFEYWDPAEDSVGYVSEQVFSGAKIDSSYIKGMDDADNIIYKIRGFAFYE